MNNPWKVTAIAVALVIVTALVTGVVGNWTGPDGLQRRAPRLEPLKAAAVRMALAPQSSAQATPSRSTVEACNRQATEHVDTRDRTTEVVKDAAMGAVLGAAVGAAGNGTLFGLDASRKHEEAYRNAYARCMRSRGYSS
jgi:NhaP-type Na+/H+ or K+/H+ antiporter